MSALDEIIARDSAPQQPSALDAIIARDAGAMTSQPPPEQPSMTWSDVSGNALSNAVPSLGKLLGDVYQSVRHPIDTAKNIGTAAMGGIENVATALTKYTVDHPDPNRPVSPEIAQQNARILSQQTPEMKQADAIGQFYKDRYGSINNLKQTIAADPAGALMDASMVANGGASALGKVAELSNLPAVANATDKIGSIANSVNPINAVTKGVYKTGKTIGGGVVNQLKGAASPFIDPKKYVGEQLAASLGDDAALAEKNIKSAQQFVPGSIPTTAQISAVPTIVATEKALANTSPDFKISLAQREAENNAARWQALNGVAQTPEALAQAQSARTAAASPLYDAAHMNAANVGKGFIDFARRPAVQQAMQTADQMARNEGVKIKWPTPDDRAIDGRALDYTSRALGDMIDSAKRAGNTQQARALTEAQDYLKNWTEQYVPGVREAAQVYAQHSIPVNTMEAGQQIANTLGTRAMNASGLPQIQLNPYRSALVQAMKGQPYGVEENAAKSLQGIGQDLQRATVSNGLRSPGSDTAYNISANGWLARQLYGDDFAGAGNMARGVGALAAAATGHPVAGLGILGGGKKLGLMAKDRLNAELANMLLQPGELLPYLQGKNAPSASPSNQVFARVLQGKLIPLGLSVGSREGAVNANN